MKSVVVFLQNAWSPVYAGDRWPRESWLRALNSSRSGARLRVLEAHCSHVDIWYDNVAPICGATPDSVVPYDLSHVRAVLRRHRPFIVVACGKHAEAALAKVKTKLPLLVVPHPAHRLLTNGLYEYAGVLITEGFTGRVVLRQARGSVVTERSVS